MNSEVKALTFYEPVAIIAPGATFLMVLYFISTHPTMYELSRIVDKFDTSALSIAALAILAYVVGQLLRSISYLVVERGTRKVFGNITNRFLFGRSKQFHWPRCFLNVFFSSYFEPLDPSTRVRLTKVFTDKNLSPEEDIYSCESWLFGPGIEGTKRDPATSSQLIEFQRLYGFHSSMMVIDLIWVMMRIFLLNEDIFSVLDCALVIFAVIHFYQFLWAYRRASITVAINVISHPPL